MDVAVQVSPEENRRLQVQRTDDSLELGIWDPQHDSEP